ncbi:MAG: CocE/NonD family hydrolase [Candidatus Latescibacteria bacterium]|nr:CocE/NonD family hydrolase [Candidatus Latescibacterota bacterium]
MERGCLTYTSDPLKRDLDVTGPVTCVLYGMSSAPDTDWVVRLSDVSPDGTSRNVCDGILRARYRDSRQHPSLLTPNQVYRYEVDLWATSNVFRTGHRIRVAVTSSNFPRFDRNLNTGGPCNEEARGQTAVNTLFHDGVRPSHIVFPVVER